MKTFSQILLYFNFFCALVLMVSYFSPFISPEKFWAIAFFGLSYPYLLMINLLFVVFWSYRFKKELLVSLIAILIGWGQLSGYYQFTFKKAKDNPSNKSFKLLSFNVRIFNLYNWSSKPDTRDKIFQFIQEENPEIICFQEFLTTKKPSFSGKDVANRLKNKYSYVLYTKNNKNYSFYGIATYSSFPIIKKGAIRFNNTTNCSIYCDLNIFGDTIRVYNNHLQSIHFEENNYNFFDSISYKNDDQKIKEIRAISSKLKNAFIKRARQADVISEHIKNSPYPVIVCGDFNDTPVSYTYHKMEKKLTDAFIISGKGNGNTYIGRFPSFRIDYILHSPSLTSSNFRTPKVILSDHYPVVCEMSRE